MTCDLHATSRDCIFCQWAASGDPVKVRAAAGRAARVANRGEPASGSPPRPAKPPSRAGRDWKTRMRACPARFKLVPD